MTLGHLTVHISCLLDGITQAMQTVMVRHAGFVPAT